MKQCYLINKLIILLIMAIDVGPLFADSYTVGGSLSGLAKTESVTLQNNGKDNLSLSANGGFTFATPVADGAPYNVTVLKQPASQTCTITNGSGTVGD